MRPSKADGTGAWMRGQGRSSAMTGEHPLEYPLECECEWSTHWSTLSCTIEIVTRLCPDGDAPWRACSWVCVSGPAARASRRGAWSCEFSSSMGAGMWSPRTPRTRRAGLGRGGGGARLSSPWTLARGQAPGGARLSTFDARVSCCVAVDGRRERVWSALCCWTGLDMVVGSLVLDGFPSARDPVR